MDFTPNNKLLDGGALILVGDRDIPICSFNALLMCRNLLLL